MSSENVGSPTNTISERAINEEDRARKRQEIGLAPQRPTASPVVQRPPKDLFSAAQRWILTLLLFLLLVATGMMIVAKSSGAPTSWPALQTFVAALIRGEAWTGRLGEYSPGPNYRLQFREDFTGRTGLVGCTQQAGEWITDVDAEQGVYRMQLWPGRLTWSTIALAAPTAYRVDISTTVVDVMPTGYSGFIGRYQNPSTFYLFMVDGLARYQIQLWQEGVLTTLQPWTTSPVLNAAGFENILGLEDNGTELHLWANGTLLATVSTPILSNGEVGLLGGAAERSMAEIRVDWLRIYKPLY
ncbi:MAG: hypothetical protein KDE19_11825 [Caldilineaceae bacterium]|nr:hypothetical protein [Caldilineaceae bacterium]